MNTSDPVECDLLFNQLIQDVFEQRVPITHKEAVSFTCSKKLVRIERVRGREIESERGGVWLVVLVGWFLNVLVNN